jgi:hypothetical protein
VIRAIKAILVLKDLVEKRVRLVNRVSKEFKVHKEKREIKVTLVRPVHKALKGILVKLDLKVQKEIRLLMRTSLQSSSKH